MDEQTLKVLARFTPVGSKWPWGTWVYNPTWRKKQWFQVIVPVLERRLPDEISEAEANQRGIFRGPKDV